MRLLFDTNVILDVLLARPPFAIRAATVMAAVETGPTEGVLCATTITTIHYLTAKSAGRESAVKHIEALLRIFQIAPVTKSVLASALATGLKDFEDAVLLEAARSAAVDAIVTRNPSDFPRSSAVPIHTPADIIQILGL